MGKIFRLEFQKYPLKLYTKYLTHTTKDMYFIQTQKFMRSLSSQRETCNNHWLGTYTKVSLPIFAMVNWMIGNISFIPWFSGWLGNISFIRVNSFPPSAAYMHQWTDSSLAQVMACRLIGAKPLPEPMLAYCQLDTWEQIGIRMLPFSFKKIHLKMSSAKMSAKMDQGFMIVMPIKPS